MGIEHRHDLVTLACLEGGWRGQGQTYPNPWGAAGATVGAWQFRFDRRRLNLIHDYTEERGGGDLFDAHGVLTVDPATRDVLWFWFDAYGHPPLSPSRGGWDGRVLKLEKVTPRGVGRVTFERRDDDLICSMETRPADAAAFIPVMAGRYARVAEPAESPVTAP